MAVTCYPNRHDVWTVKTNQRQLSALTRDSRASANGASLVSF